MNKPAIHRVAAGTKAGRKLLSAAARIPPPAELPSDVRAWNARVAAERAAKKAKQR
jgi:hypothetical protein